MSSYNLIRNNQRTLNNTLNTSSNHHRVVHLGRRFTSGRNGQSTENNSMHNTSSNFATVNERLRTINNGDNSIIHEADRSSIQNQSSLGLDGIPTNSRIIRVRNQGRQISNQNLLISA